MSACVGAVEREGVCVAVLAGRFDVQSSKQSIMNIPPTQRFHNDDFLTTWKY